VGVDDSELISRIQELGNLRIRQGIPKDQAVDAEDIRDIVLGKATANALDAFEEAEQLHHELRRQKRRERDLRAKVLENNRQDLSVVERSVIYARRIHVRMRDLLEGLATIESEPISYGSYKTLKGPIIRYLLLMTLQGRACLLSNEVLTLLRSGMTEGAAARCRALYEALIITYVLTYDHDAALSDRIHAAYIAEYERYLKEHLKSLSDAELEESAELLESFQASAAVAESFGSNLARSYEWARPLFPGKGKSPIYFADLERFVRSEHFKSTHIALHWAVHVTPFSMITAARFSGETFVALEGNG
jgi:hypothetical protein